MTGLDIYHDRVNTKRMTQGQYVELFNRTEPARVRITQGQLSQYENLRHAPRGEKAEKLQRIIDMKL